MYKIWVVDDDPGHRESLCKYLRGWGYETAYASDFEHIVEEFQQYAPHLVLMDISLPFYNRLSLVAPSCGSFPIFLLSFSPPLTIT